MESIVLAAVVAGVSDPFFGQSDIPNVAHVKPSDFGIVLVLCVASKIEARQAMALFSLSISTSLSFLV